MPAGSSADLSSATFTKTAVTVDVNVINDPYGNLVADDIRSDTTNAAHYVLFTHTTVKNNYYTLSFFVKKGTMQYVCVTGGSGFFGSGYVNFDLDRYGKPTVSAGLSNDSVISNVKVQSLPNGWFRCSLTYQSVVGGGANQMRIGHSATNEARLATHVGTTSEVTYITGLQLEDGQTLGNYTAV
jgi:hypothetical protein